VVWFLVLAVPVVVLGVVSVAAALLASQTNRRAGGLRDC